MLLAVFKTVGFMVDHGMVGSIPAHFRQTSLGVILEEARPAPYLPLSPLRRLWQKGTAHTHRQRHCRLSDSLIYE